MNSLSLPEAITERIPTEIYEHVIDQLHCDKPALSTCTLVSSTWLPRARHHLCSTCADVINRRQARHFLDAISPADTTPDLHHHLASSIKTLSTYTSRSVDPAQFVVHLPALERLYVSSAAIAHSMPSGPLRMTTLEKWFLPRAETLTDLALGHAGCDSLNEFVSEMLPKFKVLRHLALINVGWRDAVLRTPVAGGPRQEELPRLRSLILTGQSLRVVPYLVAYGNHEISRLDLRVDGRRLLGSGWTTEDEVKEVTRAIQLVGPDVKELHLYDDFYDYPLINPAINLSRHPYLRVLHLHDVNFTHTVTWVNLALQQVTSPHLQTLVIHVSSFFFQDNDDDDTSVVAFQEGWGAIQAAVLRNSSFAEGLNEVKLVWPCNVSTKLSLKLSNGREMACEMVTRLPSFNVLVPDRVSNQWFEED